VLAIPILTLVALQGGGGEEQLRAILERVSEEAEVFQQRAVKVVGQETLTHRGRKNPPRFRLRVGKSAMEAPKFTYLQREVVSEYGFGTLKEAPEALREFRQVVTVDGRKVVSVGDARMALAANMSSDDDRARKQMLTQFERHGTVGAATDFGQMILLFRRRLLEGYEFRVASTQMIGADEAIVLSYRQKTGQDAARIYHGRELSKVAMTGELWVRKKDYVPLRVTMKAMLEEDGDPVTHAATIDYYRSPFGLQLPVAVHYTKRGGDQLLVENKARYGSYQMFQVDAEIKFLAEEPEQP
jgi:hypothetical protein